MISSTKGLNLLLPYIVRLSTLPASKVEPVVVNSLFSFKRRWQKSDSSRSMVWMWRLHNTKTYIRQKYADADLQVGGRFGGSSDKIPNQSPCHDLVAYNLRTMTTSDWHISWLAKTCCVSTKSTPCISRRKFAHTLMSVCKRIFVRMKFSMSRQYKLNHLHANESVIYSFKTNI